MTTSEAPQPADPAAAAATAPAATYDEVTAVRGRSQWEIFWKRFRRHKLGMIGAIGLLVITLAAMLQVGLFTALVATAIGTVLGLMAGFIGRFTDTSISRLTDLFLAAPALPILIVVSLTFESIGLLEIVLVLALLSWMPLTRIVRANALSLKEREFVQAARAMGAKRSRILFRHLLPNSVAEIVVFATLLVAVSIITEATLSFLGLGINPARDPSWGNLLSTQSENILAGQYWWLTVFPGLFIITTVLFVNFVGDALRDALDPHGVTFEAKE